MGYQNTVGIDVSKRTLSVALHQEGDYKEFPNNQQGFAQFIEWVGQTSKNEWSELLICLEHTGLYSLNLATFLQKHRLSFAMVPALEIKRSLGIQRGKSDRIDAKAIAQFASRRREELTLTQLPDRNLQRLKRLLSLRDKMVRQRAGYQATLQEYEQFLETENDSLVINTPQTLIDHLSEQIEEVEEKIETIIQGDERFNEQFNLVTSVKGVGNVLGAYFLVYTEGFTKFPTWRKFACYCGIAPFEEQSGTSLRRGKRVHHFANKKMKSLLNMAASSAILCDPELKQYYQRRLEKGKNKMSTLNIVRNKIVARVFAVVKRGTPYVVLGKHAA